MRYKLHGVFETGDVLNHMCKVNGVIQLHKLQHCSEGPYEFGVKERMSVAKTEMRGGVTGEFSWKISLGLLAGAI